MATNLPSYLFIQFLEQLLKFLVNFTLLKYVKSQRSYGILMTKELIFGFQILDLKVQFSASLNNTRQVKLCFIGLGSFQARVFTEPSCLTSQINLVLLMEVLLNFGNFLL